MRNPLRATQIESDQLKDNTAIAPSSRTPKGPAKGTTKRGGVLKMYGEFACMP